MTGAAAMGCRLVLCGRGNQAGAGGGTLKAAGEVV